MTGRTAFLALGGATAHVFEDRDVADQALHGKPFGGRRFTLEEVQVIESIRLIARILLGSARARPSTQHVMENVRSSKLSSSTTQAWDTTYATPTPTRTTWLQRLTLKLLSVFHIQRKVVHHGSVMSF